MVLQSIRDRLSGIAAIFILGILIIPFAFVGVSSYFSSDAVNSVAVVNDQEITISEFTQSFQNYRRRMQSMLGANFDAEQFDQAIIRRQHLDSMIDQELLAQVAIDSGLTVDDNRLAQAILEVAAFEVDGQFNADVYQSRLQAQGITTQQFENDLRSRMVLSQFPSVISESAVSTEWELNEFVRLQDQQRSFSAIVVPASTTAEEADVTSEEISPDESASEEALVEGEEDTQDAGLESESPVDEQLVLDWYEAHPDDYRSEEQVVIEYLELDAATMGGEVAVDEDQLQARFEEQEARFITPESRMASHILISVDATAADADVETARQQAEALAERAREGEDFAQLAIDNSQDSGSAVDGGDLGWVEPGFMVQAFEDGLYELSMENPISDPVQSGFGWHVILLREIRPAEGMSFTEAREMLLTEYQVEADERRFIEKADRMVDIIYEDPTTLDTAAEDLDLEVMEVGPFGRLGGEGISSNPEVVRAAFSDLVLSQGTISDPVDLGENHIVMLRLKEHLPPVVRPLEEVRDEVVAEVRHEIAMDAARAKAVVLLAEVTAGSDIVVLAEEQGLEILASETAGRTSAEIPAELRTKLFLMPVPGEEGPVVEVVELSDGFAVVSLNSVTDGVVTEEEALKAENYKRRIANSSASAETMAFIRMLRSQSQVEVFEDRL